MRKSSISSGDPILILASAKRYLFDNRCDTGIEYTIGDDKACRLIDAVMDVFKAESRLINFIFCLDPDALTKALKG